MTVTTSTARVVHNGNGTTIEFAVPFRFLENGHVAVFLRDAVGGQTQWTENTQYSLAGADLDAGGTLTVNTSPTDYTPASGEKLVIVRAVPITQETDYVENDPFPAETHERAIDKLTMVNQEQTERLDRTFTIPETDTQAGNFVLPGDVDRANRFLAFDALGNPTVATGTSGNLNPVSAFMDSLLSAADAASARAQLGAADTDSATEAAAGLIELATQVETDTGTDDDRAVTPLKLANRLQNFSSLPRSYLAGLQLSNNGTDADHDIDIAVGECRDAANGVNIALSTALTKRIDASWVAGTNQGGLSSSLTLAADTWYHVHAIVVGGSADIGFDTSVTAANLVTDHSATANRRVGSVLTDSSSNIIAFVQSGDHFVWVAEVDDKNSNWSATAANIALTVPPDIKVLANITAVNANTSASNFYVLLWSPDMSDQATNGGFHNLGSNTGSGAAIVGQDYWIGTDTSGNIRHIATAGTVLGRVYTLGWIDRRGRDE